MQKAMSTREYLLSMVSYFFYFFSEGAFWIILGKWNLFFIGSIEGLDIFKILMNKLIIVFRHTTWKNVRLYLNPYM